MTKNIIRYVSVYLIVYLVGLALTFALPFITQGNIQSLLWLSRIVLFLPTLAMFIMLLCDRKFDVVALVTTLFTGLATPLLYFVCPNGYRKYAILLSICPLLTMLSWIPALNRLNPAHLTQAVVNIIVVVFLAIEAKKKGMAIVPWICIIGIVYPACAVLLHYAYTSDECRPGHLASFNRYIVPTGIVAALTFGFNAFFMVTATMPSRACLMLKPAFVALLGILVCILMFCDKRFRGIPGRVWLFLTGLILPSIAFPAAVHCYLDTDTSGLVEELPSEAVE